MTPFDLLFILSFLLTVGMLAWAILAALRGRRGRARALLYRVGIFVGVYFAVLVAVSLVSPRRVLGVGDKQCWDDWCVEVTGVARTPDEGNARYYVTLRVSSRARGRVQRGPYPNVYLLDDRNRRYNPAGDTDGDSGTITLRPGEATDVERIFDVPVDVRNLVLALFHGGSAVNFPGCCIIGDSGSLFHEPIVVRLLSAADHSE